MRAAWTIGPCLTLLLSVGACGDEPPPSDSAGGSSGSSGGEASTGNPPPGATSDGTGTSIGSADGTSTGASTGAATEGRARFGVQPAPCGTMTPAVRAFSHAHDRSRM